MDTIAGPWVTGVVACTFTFVSLCQVGYFVQFADEVWLQDRPIRGLHLYSVGFCASSFVTQITLFILTALRRANPAFVHTYMLCCIAIQLTSCTFLSNAVLFFSVRKGIRWRTYCEDAIFCVFAVWQITLLIVAVTAWVLGITEIQPFLWFCAIPWPSFLGYAIAAAYAISTIHSQSQASHRNRFFSWALLSWTACLASAAVLALAWKFPKMIIAAYSTHCCVCGLLLLEMSAWRAWTHQRTSVAMLPSAHSDMYRQSSITPSSAVHRNSSSTSTSLGDADLTAAAAAAGAPQIRKAIAREHKIFCQIEPEPFRAPVEPQQVLDVGSGFGDWACFVLKKFPMIKVTTIDIIPTLHPESSPITHFRGNINDPWTFKHNKFDLVHIRGLSGSIQDWSQIFRSAKDTLRQGGYLEFCDLTLPKSSDDGRWLQSSQAAHQIAQAAGYSFEILNPGTCEQRMVDAGFENVKVSRLHIYIGPSTTSKPGLGKDILNATIQKLELINQFGLSNLNYTKEGVCLQPGEVQSELRDPSTSPFVEVVRVMGRKCTEQSPKDFNGIGQQ